ncbi:MAG TPA: hypothetical protein VFE47_27425 [Tepidisphaeraceae bacterium]|jgi:hypothetical protein|nr:hypothetical protein [Tepidisphaeraceae bacterium]
MMIIPTAVKIFEKRMVSITLQNVRAHKGHSRFHGPPGRPLSEIRAGYFLIGDLRFTVDNRRVGGFGYTGPNVVYLCYWIGSLYGMMKTLKSADPSSYKWWYREQGDPALLFERNSNRVTIHATEDGLDGEREEYSCELEDLSRAVDEVLEELRQMLVREAGSRGEKWFAEWIVPGPGARAPDEITIFSIIRAFFRAIFPPRT